MSYGLASMLLATWGGFLFGFALRGLMAGRKRLPTCLQCARGAKLHGYRDYVCEDCR